MSHDLILSTDGVTWATARKTGQMLAKHSSAVLDARLRAIGSTSLQTLEGPQTIVADSMICLAEPSGEVWQQTSTALLRKYDITHVTADGWLVCRPKPEGAVEYFEITAELAGNAKYLQGQWGSVIDGVGTNLQTFKIGDRVCRQPHDHTDQWVVAQSAFLRDYTYPG